mgnify:FL=1
MNRNSHKFLLNQRTKTNVNGKISLTWKCLNFKNFCSLRPKCRDNLCMSFCLNLGHLRILHEDSSNRRYNASKFKASYYSSRQLWTVSSSFFNDISVALLSRLNKTYKIYYQRKRSLHHPRTVFNWRNQAFCCPRMPHYLWRTLEVKPLLL